MKIFSRFNNKGFTLIELLAVIAIIAILAAMGLVAYTSAQKTARDARRVSDMKAVQSAFEAYAGQNNGIYGTASAMYANLQNGAAPQDPINKTVDGVNYIYSISVTAGTPGTYCACAKLETNKGNKTVNNCTNTGWVNGTGGYYCVKNQQ